MDMIVIDISGVKIVMKDKKISVIESDTNSDFEAVEDKDSSEWEDCGRI